jgi:hypothetical protein
MDVTIVCADSGGRAARTATCRSRPLRLSTLSYYSDHIVYPLVVGALTVDALSRRHWTAIAEDLCIDSRDTASASLIENWIDETETRT